MHIPFKASTGKSKPNTLLNNEYKCPFCNRDELRSEGRVIKETEDFILVRNKYPVMANTFPTVLVEHTSCDEHIGTYSIEYLNKLLDFAFDYYFQLKESNKYRSIILFKNHGIFSGGSIKHPHMQVIGFEKNDYAENLSPSDFEGETILSNNAIDWNISSKPRSELYEINLILKDTKRIDILSKYLQKSVNFVLEQLNPKFKCFNLAFYIEEDTIKVKLFSRGPTSVLLLGFGIHQTPDNLSEVAERLKNF